MALAVCDLRLLLEPEAVRRTVLHGLDAASFKAGVDRMVAAEDGEDLYGEVWRTGRFTAISTPAAVTPPFVKVLDEPDRRQCLDQRHGVGARRKLGREAVEHRKMAKDALAGRADSPPTVFASTLRFSSNASSTPWARAEVTASHAVDGARSREMGAKMNFEQLQES